MGEAGEEPASRRGLFRHGGRVVRHCAREIASFPVPLLLSSAVLIVKDVDVVVVVLRIATMGAFKGVEGINGPSVLPSASAVVRPHLDHAAARYPYHDQAASPSAKRVELPDGRRTTIFCRAGASGVRTRTGD